MFSQYPVRDLIVAEAAATETTASTFFQNASALEIKVLKGDGSAVPTGRGDFKIFHKHRNGEMKVTEVIDNTKVTSITSTSPKTAVLKAYTLKFNSVPTAGETVRIKITIDNFGSLSFENQYFKYATYTVKTGDTLDDVIKGLLIDLGDNFFEEQPRTTSKTDYPNIQIVTTITNASDSGAKTAAFALIAADTISASDKIRVTGDTIDAFYELTDASGADFDAAFTELEDYGTFSVKDNPVFTFTAAAAKGGEYTLKIEEKATPYVTGKKQFRHLVFKVFATPVDELTITNRVLNPGDGFFVRDLEWFTRGNYGDFYRQMGYPHNFEEAPFDSDTAKSYYILNISYYGGDGDAHAVQKSPRGLQIACDDQTTAQAVATALTAATGIAITVS